MKLLALKNKAILCKLQKSRDKIKDNDATHVLQSKLEDIFDKICFDTRFLLCLPLPSVGFIFIKNKCNISFN